MGVSLGQCVTGDLLVPVQQCGSGACVLMLSAQLGRTASLAGPLVVDAHWDTCYSCSKRISALGLQARHIHTPFRIMFSEQMSMTKCI